MSSPVDLTLDVTQSQYDAITFPLDKKKILKIIAGPGAGKTKTLVTKIAYSLSQGVDPGSILVLSLTNRAVFALRDQLSEIVGEDLASQVNIQTFHSYSISVVAANYSNDWNLLENVGWKTLINVTHNPANVLSHGSRRRKFTRKEMEKVIKLANSGLSSDQISESFSSRVSSADVQNAIDWIYHSKIVTYADLLRTATNELNKNQDIVSNVKTVIIDEFQDMYGDLLEMVKAVAKHKNLVIAGDPNQSIFGFLGSDPAIMYTFDEELENRETTTIVLNECFRSTPEIISVADAIVEADIPRVHVKDSGPIPVLKVFNSEAEEYAFVVSELKRVLETSKGLVKPRDIALLGRTNKKIDALRHHLNAADIESVKLASVQSWVETELFHFVNYLQVLSDTNNSDHAMISVMSLLENVGTATLRGLMKDVALVNQSLPLMEQMSLWTYLNRLIYDSPKFEKQFGDFIAALTSGKEALQKAADQPAEIMKLLLSLGQNYGLKKAISKRIGTEEDSLKYQNHLQSFYESLCASQKLKHEGSSTVEHFLRHYSDIPSLEDDKAVNLSTIHSAKGLEFPICFVLAKENLYPGQVEDIEDERRNLYVGVTRASALLYYHQLRESLPPQHEFISKSEQNKYFTSQNPSFSPQYWARFAQVLNKSPGIRNYHTSHFKLHRNISYTHRLLRQMLR